MTQHFSNVLRVKLLLNYYHVIAYSLHQFRFIISLFKMITNKTKVKILIKKQLNISDCNKLKHYNFGFGR